MSRTPRSPRYIRPAKSALAIAVGLVLTLVTVIAPQSTVSGAYMTAERELAGNAAVTARLAPITNVTARTDSSGITTITWDSVTQQSWASSAQLVSSAIVYTLSSPDPKGCSGQTDKLTFAGSWSAGSACSVSYRYAGWASEPATVKVPANQIKVQDNPSRVAFSSDGTFAYVANRGSKTISVIDTTKRQVAATISVGAYPTAIAISRTTSKAYVTNRDDGTVSVINTKTNTVEGEPITVGTSPVDIVLAPDDLTAYVVNRNSSTISVINTQSRAVIKTISTAAGPNRIALTADGHTAYVGATDGKAVTVIDLAATTTSTRNIGLPVEVRSLAITADGSKVYIAGNYSNDVIILEPLSGSTNTIEGVSPADVALSNDGTTLYVTSGSNVYVLTAKSAKEWDSRSISLPYNSSFSGTLSPDGKLLYVVNPPGDSVVLVPTS